MALILGGYADGKTNAERIVELQVEAKRVEAENQKRLRAHIAESMEELEKKKAFYKRPEQPVVELKPGEVDGNSIRPGMSDSSKEAARIAIERQLHEFNNR